MNLLPNLDLLTVGLSVASILVLGFTIFFNNRKSVTNRTFLYFSICSSFWGVVNYWAYKTTDPDLSLWLFRLVMFFAIWQIFLIFRLFYVIPEHKKGFGIYSKYIILPLVIIVSILTLSPYIFSNISEIAINGVPKLTVEKGIILFAITSLGLFLSAIYQIIKKIIYTKKEEGAIYLLIFVGALITFSLIIVFNFILPAFFYIVDYIPLGAIFTMPLIILTAYALYKGKFMNIKIASASVLVFFLVITTFIEVLFTEDFWLLALRIIIFSLSLTFGLFLIKSVMREVQQREEIEKLAQNLSKANRDLKIANEKLKVLDQQKTEFVSMASHQLRSPLTAIKGYASLMLENSYGPISDKIREIVGIIFESSNKLNTVIEDFLNITRIELGKMKYDITVFDLGQLAQTIIVNQEPTAKKKGLTIDFQTDGGHHQISADDGKVTQVISNLIDNSLKYTPTPTTTKATGRIEVKVENLKSTTTVNDLVRLTVADHGVGIDQQTLAKLFDKFVRADDAGKINITGTGLGLYVAKQIVESLGGKIWAESEGKGQGSQFIVEFPHSNDQLTKTKSKIQAYTKADLKNLS